MAAGKAMSRPSWFVSTAPPTTYPRHEPIVHGTKIAIVATRIATPIEGSDPPKMGEGQGKRLVRQEMGHGCLLAPGPVVDVWRQCGGVGVACDPRATTPAIASHEACDLMRPAAANCAPPAERDRGVGHHVEDGVAGLEGGQVQRRALRAWHTPRWRGRRGSSSVENLRLPQASRPRG